VRKNVVGVLESVLSDVFDTEGRVDCVEGVGAGWKMCLYVT
jgi:hypothetical protein